MDYSMPFLRFITAFFVLSFDPGVAAPDAPDHIFIGGLGVIGEEGGGKGAACPAELYPLLRLPAFERRI